MCEGLQVPSSNVSFANPSYIPLKQSCGVSNPPFGLRNPSPKHLGYVWVRKFQGIEGKLMNVP